MGRRPFKCYRFIKNKPYPKSKYCKKCPVSKIKMFDIGDKRAKKNIYPCCINLVNLQPINISSECLESVRIVMNRNLTKSIKNKKFHLKIKMHPLHILRNNKMLSRAGADRVQTGMRNSFGKPESICARVKKNKSILSVRCRYKDEDNVINALKQACYKVSGFQIIQISKNWGFTKFKSQQFIEYIKKGKKLKN
ncbi:ribosomal protein L10e (nucleomorph) [Bigelowiella natans]|uniref:Ribosomal protein L10e n=1 Tax=Bigelowiella natans TaxID=227086 RepID=Q3LW95_BIGNA|nr:ribosomal protein L10e [Bigelowiella natans]ABA27271.1 ribosomal protein L10e [Bigelowiella natans]|mmetsp:Transcript_35269/g.59759  ORF Transcript_35269/g.59759 Transcript_35269/m.59759 type:complete len:194 (+) Transcript_35269:822-1403(+)